MKAPRLNRRIRIERPVPDTSIDGAGAGSWALMAEMAAEVEDMLPSRGERMAEGVSVTQRPSRIRVRFRTDVTAVMRVLVGKNVRGPDGQPLWQTDRVAAIITEPAELGHRQWIEFVVQQDSAAGNAA